jgi:hypothetical protein
MLRAAAAMIAHDDVPYMVLLRARFIVTPMIAHRAVVSYTAVSTLPKRSLLIDRRFVFCDTAL